METVDLILSIIVSILSILWILGYWEIKKIKFELKQIIVNQSCYNNINDIKGNVHIGSWWQTTVYLSFLDWEIYSHNEPISNYKNSILHINWFAYPSSDFIVLPDNKVKILIDKTWYKPNEDDTLYITF